MLGQAVEILVALRQLGETVRQLEDLFICYSCNPQLSPQEENFLAEHKTREMDGFEQASSDLGMAILSQF